MYTAIKGIYENGQIILQEKPPTEKNSRVLVVFVEENTQALPNQAKVNQTVEGDVKPHFSERWQGQFKLTDITVDARLDYLKQRYQL